MGEERVELGSQQEAWWYLQGWMWTSEITTEFCWIHMDVFLRSVHSFHQILKGLWKTISQRDSYNSRLFHLCASSNVSQLLNSTHSPHQPDSPNWSHPSKWICLLQWKKWMGSALSKVIYNHQLFTSSSPHWDSRPEASDLCIHSMKLHQVTGDWTPKKSLRLFTKPDLLKSLYKSEMAVSTYIHMYRKGLVFPSPSKPRVLSRVMYHRYNIQATTRALVRQRSLSSFSKSHDSVKVILPMIIHISRGLRHAGYSDRHRRRTSVRVKTTSNVEKVRCMYRAHSTWGIHGILTMHVSSLPKA